MKTRFTCLRLPSTGIKGLPPHLVVFAFLNCLQLKCSVYMRNLFLFCFMGMCECLHVCMRTTWVTGVENPFVQTTLYYGSACKQMTVTDVPKSMSATLLPEPHVQRPPRFTWSHANIVLVLSHVSRIVILSLWISTPLGST